VLQLELGRRLGHARFGEIHDDVVDEPGAEVTLVVDGTVAVYGPPAGRHREAYRAPGWLAILLGAVAVSAAACGGGGGELDRALQRPASRAHESDHLRVREETGRLGSHAVRTTASSSPT
jgi:hypothetical protein